MLFTTNTFFESETKFKFSKMARPENYLHYAFVESLNLLFSQARTFKNLKKKLLQKMVNVVD